MRLIKWVARISVWGYFSLLGLAIGLGAAGLTWPSIVLMVVAVIFVLIAWGGYHWTYPEEQAGVVVHVEFGDVDPERSARAAKRRHPCGGHVKVVRPALYDQDARQ